MKGVLISIQKPHTDNIRALIKTIEVRKTVPKLKRPFPVFIYETLAKGGCGKVIGEFVCDRIDEIYQCNSGWVKENACISKDEFFDYLGIPRGTHMGYDKKAYAWHISDLKIYDKPKSLEMFPVGKIARDCGYGNCNIYDKILTRPPQSWCYVEV